MLTWELMVFYVFSNILFLLKIPLDDLLSSFKNFQYIRGSFEEKKLNYFSLTNKNNNPFFRAINRYIKDLRKINYN